MHSGAATTAVAAETAAVAACNHCHSYASLILDPGDLVAVLSQWKEPPAFCSCCSASKPRSFVKEKGKEKDEEEEEAA